MAAKTSKKKRNTPKKRTIKSSKSNSSFWNQSEHLIAIGALLIITFIVFGPSLSNDFVNWDDDVNILENPNLAAFDWQNIKAIFASNVIGGYNPLTILTFSIEKHILGDGELKPFIFHFNNLLLHLLCVLFVYRILVYLKLSRNAALVGALLFAIHPMRVESVAWATERKDVLFGAFYFAAVITYIKHLKRNDEASNKYFIYTIVLFTLSLLSKIQAVALPLTLLALDYYFKRPLSLKLIYEKIPFFALSLAVGLFGIYTLAEADTLDDSVTTFSIIDRLFIGAYSYCVYLIKLIVPYELSPLYPYPKTLDWKFYAAMIPALGSLGGLYLAFTKDKRVLVTGGLIFIFNVFFVLQILGAGQGFLADRFTYIPYFGLFFIMAWGYEYLTNNYKQYATIIQGGALIYLAIFAFMSFQQTKIWKNGGTLWSHVLTYYQNTALPYGNRAHYFRGQKQFDKAITDYQQAINLAPQKAVPYNSLGKTYFDMGRREESVPFYSKAIDRDATEAEYRVNRGAAYASLGQYQKALADLNEAENLDPEFKNLYLNRSLVYMYLEQFDKALEDNSRYLELDPYDANIWYERAQNKRRTGQLQAALPDFEEAIRLNPNQGIFYIERARLYIQLGQTQNVATDIRRGQQLGASVPSDLQQYLQ